MTEKPIKIEASAMAEFLACVEALAGRSPTYARRRCMEFAYQLAEPFRADLLAGLEKIYGDQNE